MHTERDASNMNFCSILQLVEILKDLILDQLRGKIKKKKKIENCHEASTAMWGQDVWVHGAFCHFGRFTA